MTDRLKGCWVSFDRDIREDDAEGILNAIRMIRGVADAQPDVTNADDWLARSRVKHELRDKLIALLESLS